MERVPPEVYEPPLTRWGQTWRTAAMLLISLVVCITPLQAAWQQAHWLFVVDLLLGATTSWCSSAAGHRWRWRR